MKRLLVNVVEKDECRVAIVEEGQLVEYYVEQSQDRSLLGNVYLAKVLNIEAGIQAAFLDIGEAKTAFIHVSDLHPAYAGANGIPLKDLSKRGHDPRSSEKKPLIQDILRKGQSLLVQISKDSIGHKGPTVTSYISLPGRFLVLLNGMSRAGVSKKIEDHVQRERLRKIADTLPSVPNMGVIVRTAGVNQTKKDLERDLRYLKQLWAGVVERLESSQAPATLYQESNLVIRTIRDLFSSDIEEILVDSEEVALEVASFLRNLMPKYANRVMFYEAEVPLFHRFQIETEIEHVYDRKVDLPSGGSIVIDETEALVAIDVNSGRYRKQSNLENTALAINSEAAREIARQLRLRDLGGVVICDFIDMADLGNRREIERILRDQVRHDRSKTWITRMSRFGIIEMTRQRLRPSKDRVSRELCPTCGGRGSIRNARNMVISLMRQLAGGLKDARTKEAHLAVGEKVYDCLANDKRAELASLEADTGKKIIISRGEDFSNEHYTIQYH